MKLSLKKASDFDFDTLIHLFNDAFEGYVGGDFSFNRDSFSQFNNRNNIDLSLSSIGMEDDQPIGFTFISRQGWTSRLAAMGIVKSQQERGAGTWLLQQSLDEAKKRRDKVYILECIEQNPRGVRLYKRAGFQVIRRLVGFRKEFPEGTLDNHIAETDIVAIAKIVNQYGLENLPWQMGGFQLSKSGPPDLGFQSGPAFAVISNPDRDTITIQSLIVQPEARLAGHGKRLLNGLFYRFPDKNWVVSPICPEEYAGFFTKTGFKPLSLSQFHMEKIL